MVLLNLLKLLIKDDIYLKERRSEKKDQKSKQKQIIQCGIDQLKLQKNSLQDLCKSFDEEFMKLIEEAEKRWILR